MANVYSIEIGGRFNATQLSNALNSIKKNVKPIELKGQFDKEKLQKALNKIKSAELPVKVKFDPEQINRELNKALKNVKFNVQVSASGGTSGGKGGSGSGSSGGGTKGNIPFNEAALRAQGATISHINNELGETEAKVAKIQENAYTTKTITAKINEETEEWAQTTEKVTVNYAKKAQLQEQANTKEQAALAKQEAANNRQLEILDRRLGKLQQIEKIEGSDTPADILRKTGLNPSADITPYGAQTPVAGMGTWQRYIVSVKEGANAFRNYAVNVNEATGQTRLLDMGVTRTNKALSAQGETLDRLIIKVAKWALLTSLVYMPIRAFKEALSTLKEVDSELVTIQKVTDLSESQIKSLTQTVYGLASAYGRTADELLSMTSTFARAGFQSQLEQMTELAALTQNVGDLTGDEASKFIVAANAAWKLEGNVDKLTAIIDGMNEVTNHSANDFQALSQGITVAGSVFANAGETAQTYTAMLGTVVASTQRSGSEVARGLRTIAMNIRQIKGELDDGEIIDEASISDAAKALHSIGISVSENGELRKVSDVLTELGEKWNSLTSAEQSYVASSLAGKRQANVLVALMQNMDEYYKELDNYANGAGSAMRENEIFLDSWAAKTAVLKATWTEFVGSLVETKAIKGGLDIAIKAVDLLNTNFARTVIVVGLATKAIDVLGSHIFGLTSLKESFGILSLFLSGKGGETVTLGETLATAFGGSVLPVIAVAGAIAGIVAIAEKLIVTTKEQKEIVAQLNTEYEQLYGTGSELDQLINKEGELTSIEERRLKILQAEAELKKQEIKDEEDKYDKKVRREMNAFGYDTFNERGELITEDRTAIAGRTAAMRSKYTSLLSAYYIGGSKENLTKGLAEMIQQGEEWSDVLNRNESDLNDEEKAFKVLYDTILAVYGSYTKVTEAGKKDKVVVNEIENALQELDAAFLDFNNSLGVVDKAQQELNAQGYISVETFDELAKAYPDILKSSSALAEGYTVEENALGTLISSRETDAKVMLYNAQTAAVQYINSMSNVALATNASTETILNQIEALKLQRDLEMEVGGFGGRNNYAEYQANDTVYSQLNRLRDAIQVSDRLSKLIGSAGSTSSSSSTNTVLNGINDYYDIVKHKIWLSQQRMGDDVSLEKYAREQQMQAEYYVGLKKWAHDEAEKLRKKGYAEESDEIKKLQQIWWESENWLRDLRKETQEQQKKAIDDVLSRLKDELDLQKNGIDAEIKKYEALIDLHDAYYDTLTDIEKEQAEINKELKTAKESYQYLDEETRKLLFNESDYAVLSNKLTDIANEAAAIYENYQTSINALTEDNIYLAEQLTHEFEQQYEAKRKEYEIAKAELAMAKAQTSLQNAQNNRNTFMLVNGQFQWVADPKAIKDALEQYSEAQEEYNEAVKDASRERLKNELEDSKQTIATEKARLEAQYEAIENAWKTITMSMQQNSVDISNVLLEIAQDATPELKKQIVAFAELLSALTGVALDPKLGSTNNTSSGRAPITVQSINGQAPAGLQIGDYVQTNGGLYQIVAPNTSGATFNPNTGYWSVKVSNRTKAQAEAEGVVYDRIPSNGGFDSGGIAYGKGILLKDTASAEGVLRPSVMKDIINPTKNRLFENFVSGLSTLLDTKNLKYLNGAQMGGLTDNSITVNGMTVTGQAAENLARALKAVMPLHV